MGKLILEIRQGTVDQLIQKGRDSLANVPAEGVCFDLSCWIKLGWLRLEREGRESAAARVKEVHSGAIVDG
jgi:hypothetical protein